MKVVIDARMYGNYGIGRYTRNLVKELQITDTKNEYFILHKLEDFNEAKYQKNFTPILANFHWYGFSEQLKLPSILGKLNPDIVHFPHFNVPIFYRGKFIVTIHDLIHQHFQSPDSTTLDPITYYLKRAVFNFVFKTAIHKSSKILTPSNFVKNQLIKECGVGEEKIIVTPEAVDGKLFSIARKMSHKKSRFTVQKLNIRGPFILYTGSAHPHKNIKRLIRVFLQLKKQYRYLTLILSGSDDVFRRKLEKRYRHKDIVFTGVLSDEELVALYKNAKVYVCPSFEEGFGLPLLEAMACECPVVASDAGSLPEVGGDGAKYFNPRDASDMVEKIASVLNNSKLRKELIFKGKKRASMFSWEKLAKKTLEAYANIKS